MAGMFLSHSIPPVFNVRCGGIHRRISSSLVGHSSHRSLRYAVIGAGFAGLSVVWHLLKHSPEELHLSIDIYDEVGIGGGASGISGGLLHPYSPKVKLLWRGAECWTESIKLLRVAEAAADSEEWKREIGESAKDMKKGSIVQKRGILRPASTMKNLIKLNDNFRSCLADCRIEAINKETAQNLAPSLCVPFNTAFYMPEAVNINSQHYLQALFFACKNFVKESSNYNSGGKELRLHKISVQRLFDFQGEYDAVIMCVGAKANLLPEISGKLPLRTCRGVIAHLELPDHGGECYPDHGPSILSDAWLSVQGTSSIHLGSTWDWNSTNSSSYVSANEASKALVELMPKASAIYPAIKEWIFKGARAGLRAMPPLTSHGSLPLLGCINDIIGGGNHSCKYWLFGGLGSRGLLYHSWLGKLMAQAILCCNEEIIPSELTLWKNSLK